MTTSDLHPGHGAFPTPAISGIPPPPWTLTRVVAAARVIGPGSWQSGSHSPDVLHDPLFPTLPSLPPFSNRCRIGLRAERQAVPTDTDFRTLRQPLIEIVHDYLVFITGRDVCEHILAL